MPSKKIDRSAVYNKCLGHCAYCGCDLEFKQMQVDHVISRAFYNGSDEIDNLMPSCRQCNFYKQAMTLESFREELGEILRRSQKMFIVRLCIKYGMLNIGEWDRKFFYERLEEQRNGNK